MWGLPLGRWRGAAPGGMLRWQSRAGGVQGPPSAAGGRQGGGDISPRPRPSSAASRFAKEPAERGRLQEPRLGAGPLPTPPEGSGRGGRRRCNPSAPLQSARARRGGGRAGPERAGSRPSPAHHGAAVRGAAALSPPALGLCPGPRRAARAAPPRDPVTTGNAATRDPHSRETPSLGTHRGPLPSGPSLRDPPAPAAPRARLTSPSALAPLRLAGRVGFTASNRSPPTRAPP